MACQNLNFHNLYSNKPYIHFHPPTSIPSFHEHISPMNSPFSASPFESNMTQLHPSFGLTNEDLLNQKLNLVNQKLDQVLSRVQCQVPSSTYLTPQEMCPLCSSSAHYVSDYPLAPQYPEFVQKKVQTDHSNFAWGPQSQSFQNYS